MRHGIVGGLIAPSRAFQPRWRVTQLVSGLLYRADFTLYPDGYFADIPALDGVWRLRWNPAIPEDAQIVGGKLRIVDGAGGGGNFMGVVCDAVAPRHEQVVQARVKRLNNQYSVYVGARYTEGVGNQQYSVTWQDIRTTGGVSFLARHGWGISDTATGANIGGGRDSTVEGWKRLKIHVRDSYQRAWQDGLHIATGADATNNGKVGRPAVFINTPNIVGGCADVDEFIVCATNSVEVSGVPAGGVLRCGTDLSAPAVGGVCVLDLAGAAFPAVVEVVVGGVVVGTIGDVYGGDTWRIS